MILKNISNLLNNAVFGANQENVRKYRDIKLATTEIRRNYLVSELNRQTKKFFTKNLLAIEMQNTEILLNKPFHLELSILQLI